ESLQGLIDRAKRENHRVAIVVFGLANIDRYLKGRRQAEILHTENPKLYPHFDSGTRSFESLQPPYQQNMARLAVLINAGLRAMVADLERELSNPHHVRIEYSDALTKIDFNHLELINTVDGWHPSIEGHKVLQPNQPWRCSPSVAPKAFGAVPQRTPRACSAITSTLRTTHTTAVVATRLRASASQQITSADEICFARSRICFHAVVYVCTGD